MCISTLLAKQLFGFAVVVLSKVNAPLFGTIDESLSRTVIQSGISRKTHFLFLHRRIDVYSLELVGFDRLELQSGMDRFLQQLFGTGFTDALSPSRHARWIDRSLMLEELHPAEALVVWIFYPALNDIFIAEVVSVLQVVKSNHQPSTDCRAAVVEAIG